MYYCWRCYFSLQWIHGNTNNCKPEFFRSNATSEAEQNSTTHISITTFLGGLRISGGRGTADVSVLARGGVDILGRFLFAEGDPMKIEMEISVLVCGSSDEEIANKTSIQISIQHTPNTIW